MLNPSFCQVAFFDPTIENGIWGRYGSGAMTLEIDRSNILEAPNWLTRNHIHHSGPSVGLAITSDNVHTRLNRVSHQYALQEDGGLMQMNGLKVDEDPAWGLTNKQNWLHDALVERSTKWGLRFDRVNQECYGVPDVNGSGTTWAYHGNMERNVIWNCNGMMVKGNNHSILRNTVFDTNPLNFESDGQVCRKLTLPFRCQLCGLSAMPFHRFTILLTPPFSHSPRLPSPPLASPHLASPRLASPHLAPPPTVSPPVRHATLPSTAGRASALVSATTASARPHPPLAASPVTRILTRTPTPSSKATA